MVKKTAGSFLVAISVILILVNYVSELIQGTELGLLINLSLLSFLAGLVCIAWGEFEKHNQRHRNVK